MAKKTTRGGARQGSGAKPKYGEETKTVSFRCPTSKVNELKLTVKTKLSEWSIRFGIGDTVRSKCDVFSVTDYDKSGPKNVGKETYVVNKVEYWEQGGGYLIFGEKSNKRNCQVWHQESDLKLVSKNSH